jgi:hypothetical protein
MKTHPSLPHKVIASVLVGSAIILAVIFAVGLPFGLWDLITG